MEVLLRACSFDWMLILPKILEKESIKILSQPFHIIRNQGDIYTIFVTY